MLQAMRLYQMWAILLGMSGSLASGTVGHWACVDWVRRGVMGALLSLIGAEEPQQSAGRVDEGQARFLGRIMVPRYSFMSGDIC